jgi:hypothetical protein
MVKVAPLVRLQAKPGKEADVVSFLEKGLELPNQEATTPIWFALQPLPRLAFSMHLPTRQDGPRISPAPSPPRLWLMPTTYSPKHRRSSM